MINYCGREEVRNAGNQKEVVTRRPQKSVAYASEVKIIDRRYFLRYSSIYSILFTPPYLLSKVKIISAYNYIVLSR